MHHSANYPVFLKTAPLSIVIVGDGDALHQRLVFITKEFSTANIKVITREISALLQEVVRLHPFIKIHQKEAESSDFSNAHLVFFTDPEPHPEHLKNWVADCAALAYFSHYPELSDFEEMIAAEKDEIQNQKKFAKKISVLHRLSHELSEKEEPADPYELLENTSKIAKTAQLKSNIYLSVIGLMVFIGLLGLTIYEFNLYEDVQHFLSKDHYIFFWMLLIGFLAEMIAGSMGMGYGVICTTILLMLNVPPPIVSASIHSAESFTTAAGSISHYKLGNVNMKLVKRLAPFAILGAIIGSVSLTYFGEHYAHIVKPLIAVYTLYIGANILRKSLMKSYKRKAKRRRSNLTSLGIVGGFIDAFAGGGWGPLVTGSLIKDGRTPRFVIGSSTVTKFLLTITSAITFIYTIGIHHWNIVLGLLIGGIVTAPFSAMLTAKLPVKKMTVFISILVIIMSSITIVKSLL